jgi:carboxyl-terminal processing protease
MAERIPGSAWVRLQAGLSIVLLALFAARLASPQQVRGVDLMRGRTMLKTIKKDLQKHYYDPTFHGIDIDARFRKAEQDLEQATSLGHIFGIVAQAVMDLGDSHTRFIPPSRSAYFEYGWRLRPVGDRAYVVAVKPGSDAEAKGLKIGDAIISVDGKTIGRPSVDLFRYLYFSLRPAPEMKLVVQSPGDQPRQIDVLTKIDKDRFAQDFSQGQNVHRFSESDDKDVCIWNLPSFLADPSKLRYFAARLRQYKSVVLDLRGNPGGREDTLMALLGTILDHDVKVAERLSRGKPKKALVAKTLGGRAFKGQVVVVVDGDSASSAELFARVIQLEKRGAVIGDRTSGAVMEGRIYRREMGAEWAVVYGIIITESDLVMADGLSLEGTGVVPDILALPTQEDLANGRDPVLAQAVKLAGSEISAEQAGTLFPFVWKD